MTKKSVKADAFVRSSTTVCSAFLSSAAVMPAVISAESPDLAERLRVRFGDVFMRCPSISVQAVFFCVDRDLARHHPVNTLTSSDPLTNLGGGDRRGWRIDQHDRRLIR